MNSLEPYYRSKSSDFTLLSGDCIELLNSFDFEFDMIFADPPYFLSNDGISCHAGKIVSVNKGEWDRSRGFEKDNEFNYLWLEACRRKLKSNGTIWISGTSHNIYSVTQMLNILGFKILNCITWVKTNPPPNISRRVFTHSTEFIIWARKEQKVPHIYNYDLMKEMNGGKQMLDVWHLPAIQSWEKSQGKHPTQKTIPLLSRIILSSTNKGAWILDPFSGSSTTGIAANLYERNYLGIEKELDFLSLSMKRREELYNDDIIRLYQDKVKKILYK